MSDNGVALGRAFAAERNATDWRAYARKLEQQLLAAEANLAGNKALKDAALGELAKVDPANCLMIQQNRQRISLATSFSSALYACFSRNPQKK